MNRNCWKYPGHIPMLKSNADIQIKFIQSQKIIETSHPPRMKLSEPRSNGTERLKMDLKASSKKTRKGEEEAEAPVLRL